MKPFAFLFLLTLAFARAFSQDVKWIEPRLNTAANASYMKPEEREMIYEINRLRSNPTRYAKFFIQALYKKSLLKDTSQSSAQYAISTVYDGEKAIRDTIWQNAIAEEKFALQSLYDTLLKMKPLPVLYPDRGIYNACMKHAKDQKPTGTVDHHGSDGSFPWDRITKASPKMKFGNENLACGENKVRSIVLQLLIDSGIEGYGHRYNLLDPHWTHVACYKIGVVQLACQYWIQNFGEAKK